MVYASVAEVPWGWGQCPEAAGPGQNWDSFVLGKGHWGQNPGRGTVPLTGRSLTSSGLCGMGLFGRCLLGSWRTQQWGQGLTGTHELGKWSQWGVQNSRRGAVLLVGGSLMSSGWCGLCLNL